MYYRLHNHCKLVEGASRGAIYDFASAKVYSINRGALELLQACQAAAATELFDVNCPDNQVYLQFLDSLTAKGLGSLYLTPPQHQPMEPELADQTAKIDFLWLELTSACNNKCLHCYTASGPAVQETDKVSHDRWLDIIAEARQAGATAIQLIGGEPLLYKNWQELVIKAGDAGFEFIEIFTNATLIQDTDIDFFKRYNVSIATTIYADNAKVHDRVTLHPGSFDKTMTAINKLLAAGIPLRIASIIMKANETQADNIMKLCTRLGVEPTPPDIVRPTGRGNDAALTPTLYTKQPIQPPFYTDEYSFTQAQKYHSCLTGKIAITASGDVIPCIFARSQTCGNILTATLHEVLNGEPLKAIWRTTKDQVEKCQDCEYRYACNDCRPLAQSSDRQNRWLACSVGCSYDPYTGQWNCNEKTTKQIGGETQ
ncbi:radical SAM protein|uniref:Radical SAM additional 4Fe4S-binding SPASM domain-containing protein n=1 Tax=Dendrosporobacter quercicolus TaxID=146817 RepID=A0A1G9N742_9FIRM|nr:radical SAM protein [Dendrosporobacter quercicolus]NSL47249.1 radical SAM protein [Dendrosporobacter quercicolus DSM 1736]SDL82214.1 radical SAM additional 4Fe4S-binding SPASM domain-containing protein [Dendrosporobacter quercicolus]